MNKVMHKSRRNNKAGRNKSFELLKNSKELDYGSSTLENLASEILGDLGSDDSSGFGDLDELLHEDTANTESETAKDDNDASAGSMNSSKDVLSDTGNIRGRANAESSSNTARRAMRNLVARGLAKDNEIAKTSRSLGFFKVSDFDLNDYFHVGMNVITYDSRSSGDRNRIRRGKVVGIYHHHLVVQYEFVTWSSINHVTESFCMHDIATSKVLEAIA